MYCLASKEARQGKTICDQAEDKRLGAPAHRKITENVLTFKGELSIFSILAKEKTS